MFFCDFEAKTSKLSIFVLNGKNANFFLKFKKALLKKALMFTWWKRWELNPRPKSETKAFLHV